MNEKPVNVWLVLGVLVAPILSFPIMLGALAFGDRPEVAESVPVVTLVAEPVAADCVMFCESALALPETNSPAPPDDSDCGYMCDEPPLPSNDELCRLFCEFGPWGK